MAKRRKTRRRKTARYKPRGRVGTGARFRRLARKTGSKRLAAYLGRKKYGKKRFAKLSARGRRRRRR